MIIVADPRADEEERPKTIRASTRAGMGDITFFIIDYSLLGFDFGNAVPGAFSMSFGSIPKNAAAA
jgi:hypothetical protein